jgi:outer membrane protein TolC
LTELALRQRPELVAAQTGVIREAQRVRLARLDYLPDFEFTVGRFFNAGQRDGLGATASISLPFAYKYKYDAGFAEAEARLGSAKADLRRLENRVRKEVAAAFLSAKSALLQHELFVTTHIPQAEQALKASEIAYTTGKVDFLSLVDSVRAIESIHLEHIEASTEFEKAYADLERAVGKELTRSAL